MISVTIFINDQPVITRSARNQSKKTPSGKHVYQVDDGRTIYHKREDGAVALAIELLKGVEKI